MSDILIREPQANPETQNPPSPERMATQRAIAEVDGITDAYGRLKGADRSLCDKSKLVQNNLRTFVGNARPSEAGYRQAEATIESVGAQVRLRLLNYETQIERRVNTSEYRTVINNALKQIDGAVNPDAAQKLVEQAIEVLAEMVREVDQERDGVIESRKTIGRSIDQQASELGNLRRFPGDFGKNISRKGEGVKDDIGRELQTVDTLDSTSKADRAQRQIRFGKYLTDVIKSKKISNNPQ